MIDVIPQTFRGKVVRKKIGKGSKSEGIANFIMTDCGREFVLRQQGGHAMKDPVLDALEGKTIVAKGFITSYVFVISEFEEESDAK